MRTGLRAGTAAVRAAPCALLLAACASPAAPGLPVDWRTQPITLEQLSVPPRVTAEGGDGRVTVRGDTDLRACHSLERRATLSGGTVTFELRHRRTDGGACPGLAEYVSYEAVILGLAPGSYTLRVEYPTDGRAAANPVLEETVRVH